MEGLVTRLVAELAVEIFFKGQTNRIQSLGRDVMILQQTSKICTCAFRRTTLLRSKIHRCGRGFGFDKLRDG